MPSPVDSVFSRRSSSSSIVDQSSVSSAGTSVTNVSDTLNVSQSIKDELARFFDADNTRKQFARWKLTHLEAKGHLQFGYDSSRVTDGGCGWIEHEVRAHARIPLLGYNFSYVTRGIGLDTLKKAAAEGLTNLIDLACHAPKTEQIKFSVDDPTIHMSNKEKKQLQNHLQHRCLLDQLTDPDQIIDPRLSVVVIDVEAYDNKQEPEYFGKVKDLGICWLAAGGGDGDAIIPIIQSRHLAVPELMHKRNKFCGPVNDHFMHGHTEDADIETIRDVLISLVAEMKARSDGVCMAFWDKNQDLKWLKVQIGIDVVDMDVEVLDLSDAFMAIKGSRQRWSLTRGAAELGLTAENLHNSGNDAVLTMDILLSLAKVRLSSLSTQP